MTWAIDQLAAIQNRNGSSDLDCQAADDGMTEQAHLKDSDINNIVSRFLKTGALDEWNVRQQNPVYGDFTQGQDFQDNLNTVIAAQDAFAALPADIRKRFDNDPAKLMDFLCDAKNQAEAYSLGLIKTPPPPVAGQTASTLQAAAAAAAAAAPPPAPAPTAPKT